jgi:hypothetical protein
VIYSNILKLYAWTKGCLFAGFDEGGPIMKTFHLFVLLGLFALVFVSCSKEDDDPPPAVTVNLNDIGAGLTDVSSCSLAWGDYDNDGDLDLALAGNDGSTLISKIYRNDGGTFTDISAGLTGVQSCSLAWGDYDNDGDLDLAIAGSGGGSKVYRKVGGVLNTPPSAPAGLGVTYTGAGPYDVTFSWASTTDAETPSAGLSYNLRVGTTAGGNEVFSGMAEVTTGWRCIPARGFIQSGPTSNQWTLKGLPAGTYYWSVQAIDAAFMGGAWAVEQAATVP